MPSLSFETLPLLFALIVPGFVWSRVHRYLQIAPEQAGESWLGMFTLSAINFAIFSPWIPSILIATTRAMEGRATLPPVAVFGWACVTLLGPTAFGFATGMANRSNRFRRFLIRNLRINIPNPIGTAWDYAFSERGRKGTLWASVTLHDGSVVEGCFADQSLASSKPDERDLFIEYYFKRNPKGTLEPVEHGAGVWIAAGQIKAIEFRWVQVKEVKDGQ